MSAASWSSSEEQKEATDLHTFALAYERVLTEVMMKEGLERYPQISSDIRDIIRTTPNPLIKVDLIMTRLEGTDLGKNLYVKALLAADVLRFNREWAEREKRNKQEMELYIARKIKEVAQVAAQEASVIGARRFNDMAHMQTAAEMEHPTGTYKSFVPAPQPPLANPFTISLQRKKKGGKKSHRKKGGKKSHRKKGGKRSHRRRH